MGLFGLWALYLAIMDQGQVSVKRAYELEETFELVYRQSLPFQRNLDNCFQRKLAHFFPFIHPLPELRHTAAAERLLASKVKDFLKLKIAQNKNLHRNFHFTANPRNRRYWGAKIQRNIGRKSSISRVSCLGFLNFSASSSTFSFPTSEIDFWHPQIY